MLQIRVLYGYLLLNNMLDDPKMIELFHFPKKFEDWPDKINSGHCKVLFHKISADALIIHNWVDCKFVFCNQLSIQRNKLTDIQNGLYQILAILFFEEGLQRHFLAVTNPFHFNLKEIHINDGQLSVAPKELVTIEINKWEKSIGIGNREELKNIKYAEAHFICSDCLITQPVKIGPAELYPLSMSGIVDLSSSIKEAMLFQGVRNVPFNEIAERILEQDDRRSPLFCMSFRRIYRDDKSFVLPLLPYIKRIFGILCINRGAYSRLLGGIYLKQKEGYKDIYYMNCNSYYRGNLIGGVLSKEKPELWNEQYTLSLSSDFKSEIMSKLNSAHAELDLDISYFRLWSILESISYALYREKNLKSVKKTIIAAYQPQDVNQNIKLKLGDKTFTFDDLAVMWLDWRNCTAHQGGIRSYFEGLRKVHAKIEEMIDEMIKLDMPVEYGEDRSLMLLRDVCTKVVERYLSDNIELSSNQANVADTKSRAAD
ncbi:MAG: hypothetical protein KAV44_05110 [Bacteroidales bacterium]|nr:hypothetical protein [Bacteroidales bacterium]